VDFLEVNYIRFFHMALFSGLHIILQYPNQTGGFSCKGFGSAELANPVMIVVSGAASEDQLAAISVGEELERQLTNLPSINSSTTPCGGTINPGACHAIGAADCRKIYVRLSQSGGPSGSIAVNWDNVWAQDPNQWKVILGIPARINGTDPWQQAVSGFPPNSKWGALNACRWNWDPIEIVPHVLAQAGITFAERRIFISYLRKETSAIADQLFVELTKKGYDVFLDRYSVSVGTVFQDQLMQDIDDKSVVILLHSAGVSHKASYWVEQEIARIKQYRVGLLTLQIPDNNGIVSAIRPDINSDRYLKIESSDTNPQRELVPTKLSEVLRLIDETHSLALERRRRELFVSLGAELTAKGINFDILPGGDFSCTARNIFFSISPRPPDMNNHFQMHRQHRLDNASRGICLTPTPLLLVDRIESMGWLSTLTNVEHIDHENLKQMIDLL